MEAFRFACLFLSLSTGEIFGYEIHPVDVVLFIDVAPGYARIANCTSLENVHACVLENGKNVDSVILTARLRGLIFDVGQAEENVNESMRRVSGRAAQSLRKSGEELKMLKAWLARFLSVDHQDSSLDPEAYLNSKFRRSTDWSHVGGRPRIYFGWREKSSSMPKQRKETVALPGDWNPFLSMAKTNQTSSDMQTSMSPTGRTTSKTYSINTKNHPSPGTATTYKNIPPRKPENASRTFDNTSECGRGSSSRKTLTVRHAPSSKFENLVRDAIAARAFNQTLTEEGDISGRSITTSSEGGGERAVEVSAEGETGAKKKSPQEKCTGEKRKRRLVVDDNDQND